MKKTFKRIIRAFLGMCARLILWRKKPEIIAITGSAGKTTTKSFLSQLLSIDFNVLASSEGYNTDIGAPLVLFNEKIPQKVTSIVGWTIVSFKVFAKALFTGDYPEKIIIEMGADAPGDIEYLVKLFSPRKAIILSVLPTHLLTFKTIDEVAREKGILAKSLPEGGRLYLNYDDARVRDMSKKTRADVIFFGKEKGANWRVEDVKSDLSGTSFTLNHFGEKVEFAAQIFGEQMIYPLTSAIVVALEEGIGEKKIKEAVSEIKPSRGRMNVIPGIKGSVIIDDSYNSSPEPAILALEFLGRGEGRKIAVLGSMNELGDYEKEGHEKVGRKAAEAADLITTVGEASEKYLARAALAEGFDKEKLVSFNGSDKVGTYLKKIVRKGDIILLKGSQNKVRLEKAVEKIMAEPKKAKDILVRQSEFWQNQP